jgi:hypothetical protein
MVLAAEPALRKFLELALRLVRCGAGSLRLREARFLMLLKILE